MNAVRKKKRRVTVFFRWLVAVSWTVTATRPLVGQHVVGRRADERELRRGGGGRRGSERRHEPERREERHREHARDGAIAQRPGPPPRRRSSRLDQLAEPVRVPIEERLRCEPSARRSCRGRARRSRASRGSHRRCDRPPRRRGRAPGRARRRRASARDLDGGGRPAVVGDRELDQRELVVPAQQRSVGLSQAVEEGRREVGPDDRADRRVEDQRDAQVAAGAAVEDEVPGGDAVALDAGDPTPSPSSPSQASMAVGGGRGHGAPVYRAGRKSRPELVRPGCASAGGGGLSRSAPGRPLALRRRRVDGAAGLDDAASAKSLFFTPPPT